MTYALFFQIPSEIVWNMPITPVNNLLPNSGCGLVCELPKFCVVRFPQLLRSLTPVENFRQPQCINKDKEAGRSIFKSNSQLLWCLGETVLLFSHRGAVDRATAVGEEFTHDGLHRDWCLAIPRRN